MHGTDRATSAKPYAQYKCTLAHRRRSSNAPSLLVLLVIDL